MRAIILDQAHDLDLGYPIYADDRPEQHDDAVWAVVDVKPAGDEEWDFDYLAQGLTYDQATEWTGTDADSHPAP